MANLKLNISIIAGRLTKAAETKKAGNGTVTEFTVANNYSYPTVDGRKEEANFIQCECWGARGEALATHVVKGQQIVIEGRLKINQWKDQEGKLHSRAVVVADNWEFAGDAPKQAEVTSAAE
jgi:single-strand DNA-binding protein